jgi:hypothetical protein
MLPAWKGASAFEPIFAVSTIVGVCEGDSFFVIWSEELQAFELRHRVSER